MKPSLVAAILALAISSASSTTFAQTTQPNPAGADQSAAIEAHAEVPVRRVVLFSTGVGFFQHQGTVTGNAQTELHFKTDQINDILKSMVVSDRDAGRIKSITYPSLDPVSRTLRSFQIDISENPPLADIVNQIRGAKVHLSVGDDTVDGTILGVETKDRLIGPPDNQKTIQIPTVNVITATGIRAVPLDNVRNLDIKDETLQKELAQALAALAQARDKDKKPVIIHFDGTGERRVAIGYIVETPLWKTSYRLILPDLTSKDSAKLLGWAIVENQTDNDWNDVTLDLVGGRPLSFIENLYQPLYIPRPVVQPQANASLTPQTYDAGSEVPAKAANNSTDGNHFSDTSGGSASTGSGNLYSDTPTPRPPSFNLSDVTKNGATTGGSTGAAAETPPDYAQGVASIANAAKIGEMFQYSVKDVSLGRQRSSMIPIVTEAVDFDRVSIFNAAVLAKNPLHGIRLKNKTGKYLLSGPISVMDMTKGSDGNLTQNYAGDARIDDLPSGQERLLSYGVDQDVLVDATHSAATDDLVTGSIVKGVLTLKFLTVSSQDYAIDNKADREKTVLVEHPINDGFELKSPDKPLEKTAQLYRFQLKIPAKSHVSLTVRQEHVRSETLAILRLQDDALVYFTKQGAIPKNVKDILAQVAQMHRNTVSLERQKAEKEQDRARTLEEQKNVRENIRVLPVGSKSQQDAINDLSAKDADLKELNKTIKELQQKTEASRAELEKFVTETTIE